jgi:hypothetical protein
MTHNRIGVASSQLRPTSFQLGEQRSHLLLDRRVPIQGEAALYDCLTGAIVII